MKKIVLMLMMAVAAISAHAQKYALVDMEYILRNIPAYERANEQLNQVSRKWQDSIMQKEKEASDLKKKYFGAEGELYKKREALMGPIQEEIYNAVKEISNLRGYSLVLDRASNNGIIFGSPKIDISNEVLQKLGYSNK